jgi:hypothetical protein
VTQTSTNGGLHHEEPDTDSPLPQWLTVSELSKAVTAGHAESKASYDSLAASVQGLHDALKASDAASARMHAATLKAVASVADSVMVLDSTTKAIARHVEALPTKAELGDLGAQMGRQALVSITEDAKLAADVKRVRAIAAVRIGGLLAGGAALYKIFDLLYPLLHR